HHLRPAFYPAERGLLRVHTDPRLPPKRRHWRYRPLHPLLQSLLRLHAVRAPIQESDHPRLARWVRPWRGVTDPGIARHSGVSASPVLAVLDAAGVRMPDVLVRLQLKANREPVLDDPLRQLPFRELTEHRREQQRKVTLSQPVSPDHVSAPFVIGARSNHKFELVLFIHRVEDPVVISIAFARRGRLQVDDLVNRRWNEPDVDRA